MMALEGGQDDFVLREESGERRNACNSEYANEAAPIGQRHFLAKSAHGVQIVRMHLVNQATCNQEQGALEECMRKDVEGRSGPASGNDGIADFASAKRKHHVAELRKRGVGENALDVFLRAGDNRGKNHREGAHPHNQRERIATDSEEREESCNQVNTCDHHGGAVND